MKRVLTTIAVSTAMMFAAGIGHAADIKERSAKFPIVNAIDHPQGLGAQKFVEVVEKKSGGKIKVKVFPNGTLGGEQQVAAAMQGGTIEVSMMSPAQLVGTIKEFVVLDFPFSFANTAQADAVLDGPFGKKLMDYMPAKGWVGLGFMEQGYRSISNSKRPINKLEDIKGLKIRTILNPLYVDMFNTLGANAVPMPFPELYTAMEMKTVDGQENPLGQIYTSRFYEVQKYATLSGHTYSPEVVVFSLATWKKIPAKYQEEILKASAEAKKFNRDLSAKMDKEYVGKLKEKGMTVTALTAQQIVPFQEKMMPVWDLFADKIGKDLIQKIKDTK